MKPTTEMISFVSSLELEEPTIKFSQMENLKSLPTAGNDGKEAGYVAGGSLVSFVAGVSEEHQSDVLNSTLLAQLAANKKYDQEKQTEEWYNFYRTVLTTIGWVAQEFNFEDYQISASSGSVDKIVLEVLAAIASQNEIAVAMKTFEAIKKLPETDNRVVLWDGKSHKESSGNFQIALCADTGGVVVTKIGCFYFSSEKKVAKILWFDFSSSNAHMHKSDQTISLNKDVYSQVRQQIIDKLGDKAKTFIQDLDI